MNLLLLVMGLACFTKSERITHPLYVCRSGFQQSQMHTHLAGVSRWMRGLNREFSEPWFVAVFGLSTGYFTESAS